jgi:MarR family transcriptional regulator, organic hydroperoxide resistance regulator
MQDDRVRRSLGYALVRAFRNVNRATSRALLPFELSSEQAHILLILWIEGPMKIGELQRLLALSSGTLTGAIDRMDKAGLVRRVPDPTDGRAYKVEPVAFDAKRRRAIETTLEGAEAQCFSRLTSRESQELFRLLQKLSDSPS